MEAPERKLSQLSVADALKKMLSSAYTIDETERVDISESVSRVLAQDLKSTTDSPPFHQASVDGIAFCYADLALNKSFKLIESTVSPKSGKVPTCDEGECMFVVMGSPLPQRCDTVQKQSLVEVLETGLNLGHVEAQGQYVRERGEEIKANSSLFSQGKRISVADIGLLSSAGVHYVRIFRKARVSLLSIGDDLRSAGAELNKGQRFDSNRYMLSALLASSQAELIDSATISDDYAALTVMMQEAAVKSDLILLSGAMSEENIQYMKRVLKKQYKMSSWQIKLQHGKSLMFGKLESHAGRQTLFCGLPSHPASSLMSYCQLVIPMLDKLSGIDVSESVRFLATLTQPIEKKSHKVNYLRGFCASDAQGELQVHAHAMQDELTLTSFAESNCFIILPTPHQALKPGDKVWVEYFPTSLR
tara:strand:+ start:7451 stop:8704 length:1254 start_codon:yes stop_codon:yes gene_type:complete